MFWMEHHFQVFGAIVQRVFIQVVNDSALRPLPLLPDERLKAIPLIQAPDCSNQTVEVDVACALNRALVSNEKSRAVQLFEHAWNGQEMAPQHAIAREFSASAPVGLVDLQGDQIGDAGIPIADEQPFTSAAEREALAGNKGRTESGDGDGLEEKGTSFLGCYNILEHVRERRPSLCSLAGKGIGRRPSVEGGFIPMVSHE